MDDIRMQQKTSKRTVEHVKQFSDVLPKKRRRNVCNIVERSERISSFHKRIDGIMKKAHQLTTLTGCQVLLFVVSETDQVYTFSTQKFRPMLTTKLGLKKFEDCLNGTPSL